MFLMTELQEQKKPAACVAGFFEQRLFGLSVG
jgi:hypothetical protein